MRDREPTTDSPNRSYRSPEARIVIGIVVVYAGVLALGQWTDLGPWLAWPIGVAMAVLAVTVLFSARRDYFRGTRKMARLENRRKLYVADDRLVLENTKGRRVAYVKLSEDFEVSIPFKENGRGYYRVVQGWRVLEFNSDIPNAEHIVRDVLGCDEWPPDFDWILPF